MSIKYDWRTCPYCETEFNSEQETCHFCRNATLYCDNCEKHFTVDEAVRVEVNRDFGAPYGDDMFAVQHETGYDYECPDCHEILIEE